jgi:hypothetical protein
VDKVPLTKFLIADLACADERVHRMFRNTKKVGRLRDSKDSTHVLAPVWIRSPRQYKGLRSLGCWLSRGLPAQQGPFHLPLKNQYII